MKTEKLFLYFTKYLTALTFTNEFGSIDDVAAISDFESLKICEVSCSNVELKMEKRSNKLSFLLEIQGYLFFLAFDPLCLIIGIQYSFPLNVFPSTTVFVSLFFIFITVVESYSLTQQYCGRIGKSEFLANWKVISSAI